MPPPIYAAVEAKTGYSIPSLNHRVIDQQAQTGRACLADRVFVPEDSDFADSKDISGPLEFGNIVGQTIESWALRTETPPPAQTTTSQPSPERVRALQDCREEAVRSVRDPIRPLLEWISSAGQETSAWIGADPRTSKITHVFRDCTKSAGIEVSSPEALFAKYTDASNKLVDDLSSAKISRPVARSGLLSLEAEELAIAPKVRGCLERYYSDTSQVFADAQLRFMRENGEALNTQLEDLARAVKKLVAGPAG